MSKIFGSSPRSSIAGYALAALMIVQDMTSAGKADWTKIGIAIAIAILGRVVKDSDGNKASENK